MSKDQELAQQNQDLEVAESIQKDITNDLSAIKEGIRHTGNRAEKLLQQKKKLERKLKLKMKEQENLIIIITSNQKQPLEDKAALTEDELVELKQEKEEEIAEHKVELEEVESKLREAENQISGYEEQLHQFSSELMKLFGKLKSLREVNAKTKQELDLEREKVDHFCMQQTAAKNSENTYRKETQVNYQIEYVLLF